MSLNCTQEDETFRHRAVKVSVLGIILIVAVLLNVKTFFIILNQKRGPRKAVTIFLLNMTLVSGLMALLLIPFNIYAIIKKRWGLGGAFCQINGFTNVFLCTDLNVTLVCVTIDRYYSVIKPLRHRVLMTRRVAWRMLVAGHILSFLVAVIPITGEPTYEYHPGTNHCSPTWHKSSAYYYLMMSLGFFTPILGMLVTYTRIILRVRSNRRLTVRWKAPDRDSSRDTQTQQASMRSNHVSSSQENYTRGGHVADARVVPNRLSILYDRAEASSFTLQQNEEIDATDEGLPNTFRNRHRRSVISSVIHRMRKPTHIPQEYKIARAGFILFLAFTILWTPYLVAHTFFNGKCRAQTFFNVAMFLVYLNAVANPVIYALTNRTVMRDLKSHFKRACRCQ